MKTIVLVAMLSIANIISYGQTKNKTTDTINVKYRLSEYLLSCQSMASAIMGEKDYKMKTYLGGKGYEYYNKAYQEYIKLQSPEYGELNKKLSDAISTQLQLYSKIYSDISLLNDPNYMVALAFMDKNYKELILPELWDKK